MGTTVFANVSTPGPAGPPGPAGYAPQFIVASGAPSNSVGNVGDMFIDSSTGNVYGPKATGGWGSIACNIRGATGAAGPAGPAGYSPQYIVAAGAPTGAIGNNGDMYINSSTSDVYGPKTSGAWGAIVCNIKGATGAQGPPGVAYTPRGAWSSATTYAQGDEVTSGSQLYISLQSGNLNHDPASSPTYWQMVGSGGSQTPWLSNIDGNGKTLGNAGAIGIGTATPYGPFTVHTGVNQNLFIAANSGFATVGGVNDAQTAYTAVQYLASGHFLMGGNVGIGTTSPTQTLQVVGSIYANAGEIVIDSGHGLHVGSLDVGNYAARGRDDQIGFYGGNLILQGGGTGFTGKVGIGGTNPQAPLDVAVSLPSQAIYEHQRWTASAANMLKLLTVWDANGINQRFVQRFSSTDYNSLCFFNGCVGMGLTNPASKLEVADTIISSGGSAGMMFRDRATNTNGYMWYANGGNALIYNMNNGTTLIEVSPSGVGIGGLVPAFPLHVYGRSLFQNPVNEPYVLGLESSQSSQALWLGTDSSNGFVVYNSGGSVLFTVTAGGNAIAPGVISATTRFSTNGKTNQFGTAANTAAGGASAPTTADANIVLYDFSGGAGVGNWAGIGIDGGGNMWFRTGLSGSPNPALFISSGASGAIGVGTLAPGYKLDIAGDCNLSAGSVYRINGVPITTGGGITTQVAQSTSARQLGVSYQNTTGKPMMVTVSVTVQASMSINTAGGIDALTDAANPPTTIVAYQMVCLVSGGPTGEACVTFWVLPGNWYKVVASASGSPTIVANFWTEWY